MEENKKRKPTDEYDCWQMDCRECEFYDEQNEECVNPEAFHNLTH